MIQPVISLASSAVPVTTDDVLNVDYSFASQLAATLVLRCLILTDDGELVPSVTELAAPAASTTGNFGLRLTGGILANVSLTVATAGIETGGIWAKLYIQRGKPITATQQLFLTSGFISSDVSLTYPSSGQVSPSFNAPPIVQQTISNPGPGAEISAQINASQPSELVGLTCDFITDVNVANRRISWTITTDFNRRSSFRVRTALTAGITYRVTFWLGGSMPADDTTAFFIYVPIPDACQGPFFTIETATDNIQAGDEFQNITVFSRVTPD